MIKITKFLGILNVVLNVFLLLLLMSLLVPGFSSNGSYGSLAVALSAMAFIVIALILSIPAIIFLMKYKLPAIRFYFYTHILFFIMSILLLVVSLLVE